MKKIVFLIYLLAILISFPTPCSAYEWKIGQQPRIDQSKSAENSEQTLCRDMLISLLVPYMQKEINNYYKEYLTELPMIFPYSVDIVNIERQGQSGYLIRIEVIAHPFIGPENTVGDDRIILETGAFGSVKTIKYEHLKSYELPWNWKHIIKKPY